MSPFLLKPKFGAHQFLWKSHFTDQDLGILDVVRSLGLLLFEVSLGDDVAFDYTAMGRHAHSLGIELTVGPGNSWPAHCNISSGESENRKRGLAWHKATIDRASEMDAAAYCGAIYSHPGYILHQAPDRDEFLTAAENLHVLAEYADRLGVKLVLEPMSRFRNHLVTTATRIMELIALAQHRNILVNLDTFHMITEERDYGGAIRTCLPLLWGIHACENDRGVPGGGLVPWASVMEALQGRSVPTRMLFETYNTGPAGFGFSRGIYQDLCPDPEDFVRRGLAFFSSTFGLKA
jgi:D-psicose/D-tagatose/L-ribulose 3-epimerase